MKSYYVNYVKFIKFMIEIGFHLAHVHHLDGSYDGSGLQEQTK